MTTTETALLTADDLLQLDSEGVRGELVRGVFHETMTAGELHGKIVTNLIYELATFTKPRRLGTLLASDAGIWLERNPDTVREPDVAFISADRLPLDSWNPHYCAAVPDLVVEVASPRDSRRWLRERAQMWLGHGVPLVWIVQPAARSVDVYRPGVPAATHNSGDTLDGFGILPGFTCIVGTIFEA